MSISKNYYTIAGYDLTGWDTDKYEDWKWTDESEKYTCYQRKGQIQLFDDPMSGSYLYFGYVLAEGDEYEFNTTKFDAEIINQVKENVKGELTKLIDLGVISKDPKFKPKYEVIVFEECT